MKEKLLNLAHVIYEDHLTPAGHLPREHAREASAAFHFARLANRAYHKVPEQATYEGELDQTVRVRALLEATCILYQIPDPNDLMRFMPAARREVHARGWYWDNRFDAWIASAGKSYDEVTREEGRLNHD